MWYCPPFRTLPAPADPEFRNWAPSLGEAELQNAFQSLAPAGLPTCPGPPLRLLDNQDRSQPALDLVAGDGMQFSVGRLRSCPVLGWKFTALVDNRIRGGTGAMLHNAEFLARRFGWADSAV